MFRIRRVFDDVLPANRKALDEVVALLRSQFRAIAKAKMARIPDLLRDPVKHRFRSVVYVAEGSAGKVRGAALLNHEPEIGFSYLDYLATDKALSGRGVGGALYQRVRQETALLNVGGLFFECLPDDPALCRDSDLLKQNRARLRFYERFGARPIVNTAYETPVYVGSDNPAYLVFDDLGQGTELRRDYVQRVIAYVLRHKYRDVCTPAYVRLVVDSVKDDPVRIRPPRYSRAPTPFRATVSARPMCALRWWQRIGMKAIMCAIAATWRLRSACVRFCPPSRRPDCSIRCRLGTPKNAG
jgi:GNAT superfamily N-acetyltransferase